MISLALLLSACDPAPSPSTPVATDPDTATRLHWFIPDGLRADPEVFDVYRWAREGKLPHLKALMERGAYGYSIPAFPSHTPANTATLLTGALPETHGVADGPMHVEGFPLARPSVGGFSSAARKVPAAWSLFEEAGQRVVLLSLPGSTPPELGPGSVTVRGRWGGWGPELPAVIFERADAERRKAMARSAKLFLVGEELTRFVEASEATAPWAGAPPSDTPAREIDLSVSGAPLYGLLVDPPADGRVGYERLILSQDRAHLLGTLASGEWSAWFPATARWKDVDVPTNQRVELIKLGDDGFFRVRVLFDGLNALVTEPPEAAEALRSAAGPMVDYPDSYPAQLVFYPEDKGAFLAESQQSLAWHRSAVDAVYTRFTPDVFIHGIYTPNQMLTSRWWLGHLDPASRRYHEVDDAARARLWDEVMGMYRGIDEALGRAVANLAPDAVLVLSSDHGAIPLERQVHLNNLFAARGWLTVTVDPATGAPEVDWEDSKVVFLNTYNVYIDPEGLGGDWTRARGPAYEVLRAEVEAALAGLRDGERAVATARRWEEAGAQGLPGDRVGDLLLTAAPGYAWTEQLTDDRALFSEAQVSGYKQGVDPERTPGLWTPFVIVGPGVKAGHRIAEPIHAIDQLPTILRAMGQPIPATVQGQAVDELFAPR
ncbi:MAG: alkaline phosphatase family protein [Deltaproteobacteria bacterium]|nr:alkaline phosphatase family protein [Deltaproteobacteria bacterium]